jgi:hypothetical protein
VTCKLTEHYCAGTLFNASRFTQHSTVFACRQAVQLSPLFGLAVSVGPRVRFLRVILKRVAGSGFFRLTDTCLTEQVRCMLHVEVMLFKKPHLGTFLSSDMPHKWFSSALPDICPYVNSNWDTATQLHICYNSLFSLLS